VVDNGGSDAVLWMSKALLCVREHDRPDFNSDLRPIRPFQSLFTSSSVGIFSPAAAALYFALSVLKARSSMRICLSRDSFIFFELRQSPSCFAIFAFISARSMSHAFRARSWLCHSI